jgi:hypothetical protein
VGTRPEDAIAEKVSEPVTELLAPITLTSELSHKPTLAEFSEQPPIPDAATRPAIHPSRSSDSMVERLASEFTRTVYALLGSLPEKSTQIVERASYMVRWLARTLSGVVGGRAGAPIPGRTPLVPLDTPAAPPPAVPIPVGGGSSLAGGSFSGGSDTSGAQHKVQPQQFGVLKGFSVALLQGNGRTSVSRKPLAPSSVPRPPNEHPG